MCACVRLARGAKQECDAFVALALPDCRRFGAALLALCTTRARAKAVLLASSQAIADPSVNTTPRVAQVDSEHRRAEEVQRLATEPAALPNMRERVGVLMPDGSTCFAVVDIPGANEREAAEQARWEKAEADREALKRRLAGAPGADLENRGTEELVQALREQEAQAAAEQGLEYDQAVNACVRAPAELPGTPSSK